MQEEPGGAGAGMPHRPITEARRIAVADENDVVLARQAAFRQAEAAGLGRRATYEMVTAVSELGMNLVLHACGARHVVIEAVEGDGGRGVVVTSLDDGPGIPDIERAMQDGYSTAGGLGSGLPGARRLMDDFTIDSRTGPGGGTRIRACKWRR